MESWRNPKLKINPKINRVIILFPVSIAWDWERGSRSRIVLSSSPEPPPLEKVSSSATMAYAAMKPTKPGLEESQEQIHKIRITLSSKNVKNLEKGILLSICFVDCIIKNKSVFTFLFLLPSLLLFQLVLNFFYVYSLRVYPSFVFHHSGSIYTCFTVMYSRRIMLLGVMVIRLKSSVIWDKFSSVF